MTLRMFIGYLVTLRHLSVELKTSKFQSRLKYFLWSIHYFIALIFMQTMHNDNDTARMETKEIKVLRWDFNELDVHHTHSDQNNWIWNQNQRDFKEIAILNFYYVQFWPLFMGFGSFFQFYTVLMLQDDWRNAPKL